MDKNHQTDYGSVKSDYLAGSYDSRVSFHTTVEMSHEVLNEDGVEDERTPLNGSTNTTRTPRQRTMTSSLYQSISKYTTSNYFGFGSTSYAVAKMKERAMTSSKTISLADIPSFDRLTPTLVSFFTEMSFITGLSVFAIPLVVANCGIPMLIGLIIGGILLCYATHIINLCQYQISKTGVRKRIYENYIDLGRAALTWHGETIMKIMVGSSVLTDIYTLIFCAQISKDLTNGYLKLDDRVWMLIWMAVVFPLFFIRRMSALAWLGFFSLVFYVAGLSGLFGLLVYHHDMWNWKNLIPEHVSISYMFIGYGIIVNSYNVHLSMPAVEASMKHPKSYSKMNNTAFAVNTILKLFLAITAVATFGINTQGSVLANFIIFGRAAVAINVLIGLYMITQYPTSLFVVLEMVDMYGMPKFSIFKKGHWSEWAWMFLSRLIITVFIVFVAVSIPNFEMVTGFIGNIRGTLATLVFPIYFYLKLHGRSISKLSRIFHLCLIVIVSCLGLAGATCSILGMLGHIY